MEAQVKSLAEDPNERRRWFIQKYFKILPTNSDFMKLTDAQLLLLEAHIDLDWERLEAERNKTSAKDGNYDEEEPEKYSDPNFDEALENLDTGDSGEVDKNYVAEEWEEIT